MRQVFKVICNRDYVKTFSPCFFRSDLGPHRSIRKHGMHVEVTFQCKVAGNIRYPDLIPDSLSKGRRSNNQKHKNRNQNCIFRLSIYSFLVVHSTTLHTRYHPIDTAKLAQISSHESVELMSLALPKTLSAPIRPTKTVASPSNEGT